jgi:hypothetical protein
MYFIGNFQHVTHQLAEDENERRHGSFSMMVTADSTNEAMERFRQKLLAYRKSTTFFEGRSTVFITQLLEFEQFPQEEAIMLNFKSFAGDPMMPFIACSVPTEQSNACKIHEWEGAQPFTEGRKDAVFVQFD